MVNSTKPRFGAIAAGALCAFGAAYVLLEDVRHTGTVTTDHILAVIVLVGTIAAGVMAVSMLKSWRTWHYAAALFALAAVGSVYCMMGTAGRTAQDRATAQLEAEANNEKRNAIRKKIAEAEFILASCPAGSPKKWFGERCSLRDAKNRECASGNGTACQGKSYSVGTYEAAIKGHTADLDAIGPEVPVNTRVKNAAAIISAIQGADAEQQARLEATLTLIEPNIPAAFLEAGSIVFLHIGLAGVVWSAVFSGWRLWPRREIDLYARMKAFEASQSLPTSPEPTPPVDPKPRKRSRPDERREQVASFVGAYRARHGHDPEPAEVRRATGLPRSTAWRYQQELLAS